MKQERFAVVAIWKNMDDDYDWFESVEAAKKWADIRFSRFTREELKRLISFFILESVNPDPDAANHWDGNTVWQADIAAELDK